MTQPHYPHIPFSVSVCLPLRTPFVIRSYDILIKVVQQVMYPSSGARVHRAGAPGPALDGSSERASHVGCEAGVPARLATIHRAGNHHGAELAGVALSRLT